MYNDYGRALLHGGQPYKANSLKPLAVRGPAGRLARFYGKYVSPKGQTHQKPEYHVQPFSPHPRHLPSIQSPGNEPPPFAREWADRLLCNSVLPASSYQPRCILSIPAAPSGGFSFLQKSSGNSADADVSFHNFPGFPVYAYIDFCDLPGLSGHADINPHVLNCSGI